VRLTSGARIGPYEVVGLLGSGGMGEVYAARDLRLDRTVAIKILPEIFLFNTERLGRFEREARVLASLNHPHIGAIYGVEDADGVHALILELVEGTTLADRLAAGPLPLGEALLIARQIADALDAAHEKGIVHRDLKPANIKITPAGVVKVLDFGLAKATAAETSGPDPAMSPTTTADGTRAGVVLGTAAYMSPEQARGRPLDKRSDIWSFGCVLYEMLAGRPVFAGDTVSDIISAILRGEPDWTALPKTTTSPVRRLLQRCLEKDGARRLRDIGDARLDIEEALAAPSAIPFSTATLRERSTRERVAWSMAAALSIALIAASVAGWRQRSSWKSNQAPTFSRIVRLTSGPARESGPALSPDGKWVAYLSNSSGRPDVWVRFIAGGQPVNLTASSGLDVTSRTFIGGPEISPDGARVAFTARPRGSSGPFGTWEIPGPLPGAPRKLLEDGLSVRWSPDGRQIAFIRAGAAAGDELFVADSDGTNRRKVVQARGGMHLHWPAWSHDGYIYFIHTLEGYNAEPSEIYRVSSRGSDIEPVVRTPRRAVFPLPVPDGTGLIYAANPTAADLSLWWRSATRGEPRRLTTGVGEFAEPRLSSDGRTLVCTLYDMRQSLERIAVTGGASPTVVALTDGYGGDLDPSLAPHSDRLIFSSSRGGSRQIWTVALEGSDARPLTSGVSLDEHPSVSPDGQLIAFVSDRGGQRSIWTVGLDGGAPRKLTNAGVIGGLSWSPNGDRLVFSAADGDWLGLWTVSLANGEIRRLLIPGSGPAAEPAWCPTRDVIAYMSASPVGVVVTTIMFIDSLGQPKYASVSAASSIAGSFANGMLAWGPDGRKLAAVSQPQGLPSSIWIVEPDSPNPYRRLIELPLGPRIRGLTWTPDGSAVIIGKQDMSSDIVLMDQQR
jgi:eukaryotic-like serine/threonine-protein kinase